MTPDGDWTCDQADAANTLGCYAVWQCCDDCNGDDDECESCQGSGGGHICGVHDLDDR